MSIPMSPICGSETSANRDSIQKFSWEWIYISSFAKHILNLIHRSNHIFFVKRSLLNSQLTKEGSFTKIYILYRS
ncbi:hypothetical protein NPIL_657641 [Nephila pilipes]|uniref:Uncharacterized protein n=1 Tax=Nephila pilipes TaxID=299642 RepID=A0A8X6NS56_NEPPI|nr:hypothetical protein NPIL_657641 [Nephila pilipes]